MTCNLTSATDYAFLHRRAQDQGSLSSRTSADAVDRAEGESQRGDRATVELAAEAQTLLTRILELAALVTYDPAAGLPLNDQAELIQLLFGDVEPETFFVTEDGHVVVGPVRTGEQGDPPTVPPAASGPGLLFGGWSAPPFARMLPLGWDQGQRDREDERAIEPGFLELPAGFARSDEDPLLRHDLARQRRLGAIGSIR